MAKLVIIKAKVVYNVVLIPRENSVNSIFEVLLANPILKRELDENTMPIYLRFILLYTNAKSRSNKTIFYSSEKELEVFNKMKSDFMELSKKYNNDEGLKFRFANAYANDIFHNTNKMIIFHANRLNNYVLIPRLGDVVHTTTSTESFWVDTNNYLMQQNETGKLLRVKLEDPVEQILSHKTQADFLNLYKNKLLYLNCTEEEINRMISSYKEAYDRIQQYKKLDLAETVEKFDPDTDN